MVAIAIVLAAKTTKMALSFERKNEGMVILRPQPLAL